MFTKRNPEGEGVSPPEATVDATPVTPETVAPRPATARPAVARPAPVAPAPAAASPTPAAAPMARPAPSSATAAPQRSTVSRTAEPSETGKLHVGREIKLKGEIGVCERLVVEGSVDATLMECRSMEVAPGGFFTGQAQVDTAEVSGHFEGELTVEGLLTVTSTGRLSGTVRFGELQVERGGTISGSIEIAGSTTRS